MIFAGSELESTIAFNIVAVSIEQGTAGFTSDISLGILGVADRLREIIVFFVFFLNDRLCLRVHRGVNLQTAVIDHLLCFLVVIAKLILQILNDLCDDVISEIIGYIIECVCVRIHDVLDLRLYGLVIISL